MDNSDNGRKVGGWASSRELGVLAAMNEFRDAIADAIDGIYDYRDNGAGTYTAREVLAMPEMAAIRNLIHAVAMYGIGCIDSDAMLSLYYELPGSVVDWVHGDEVAS